MRTYVFITTQITGICGAAQYIYNKSGYLKKRGWRVLVFSSKRGEIIINGFSEYEKYIYPILRNSPDLYRKREVFHTVDAIAAEIGDCQGDPCVIETESVIRAAWAEMIAQKLQCRHFVFPLQEQHDYTPEMRAFLRFKYDRHELAGIADQSVNQMLTDDTAERRTDTKIRAFCTNVIADCPDTVFANLDPEADFTLCSIGRLSKPYVLPLLDAVKDFILSCRDKSFNLILIGGEGSKERIDAIQAMFRELPQVKLVLTGNMYPISRYLVDRVDAFVSTAGAASATYRYGRPTVLIHPLNGKACGIPGLDFVFRQKSMYEEEQAFTVQNCLKRILLDQVTIDYPFAFDETYQREMEEEFARQLSLAEAPAEKEYYSIDKLLRLSIKTNTGSIQKILGKCFGDKVLIRVVGAAVKAR